MLDDEGDLITMSSDEELTAALASKRDDKGIFRIYVKCKHFYVLYVLMKHCK